MQWIIRSAHAAIRFISRVNSALAVICGAMVFVYMFLVAVNIIGRYFFNKPIDGTLEIGQIVLASVIFFSLAYAQMEGVHIRVKAIMQLLPKIWQEYFETAILLIGFLMMVLMAWKAFPFAIESFKIREAHMSVDIPIWPTKFIFFIGWSILGFQFLLEFLGRVLPGPYPRDPQTTEREA